MITGSGAVGFPANALIRSGKAKKPITTNNKKERRFSAAKSSIEVMPIIIKKIPITIHPTTKIKVSNNKLASGFKLSKPNASNTKAALISGENIAPINGNICSAVNTAAIQKIVFNFII